jgi:DNA-binding transcriptional MerR regulator
MERAEAGASASPHKGGATMGIAEASTAGGSATSHGDADTGAFTIGQLTQEFGLTLRTLRFYEHLGLLSPRRSGTARLYSRSDHDRIALILHGKRLGFTLREIRQLLASPQPDGDQSSLKLSRAQCVEQINLLERQKTIIETALVELRRTYSSLYTRALAREKSNKGGGEDAA